MIRGLDDAEIEQVMAAAAPLAPEHRADFLRAVVNAMAGAEPGPGSIHRAIATVQRKHLNVVEGRRPKAAGKYR